MVEVKGLTKKYGDSFAVRNISFTVEKGRICGFLGPNGAGKSTTMNVIAGCLAATFGTVRIDGHDVFEEPLAAKRLVGYLPEVPPLYPDMTPREYLGFVADAKGIKRQDKPDTVAQAMEKCGVADVADRLIRNLSKGYCQRVGIAQAILGDPQVIILDEPTVGLDPRQIVAIRDLIKELGRDRTVILSSHLLSEVQEVCASVFGTPRGRIVASGAIDSISSGSAGYNTVKMEIAAPPEKCFTVLDPIEEISHYAVVEGGAGTTAELTIPAEYDLRARLFAAFAEARLPVCEMYTVKPSLEKIYLELTDENAAARRGEGAE